MSGIVGSAISKWGMVEKCGGTCCNHVAIAFRLNVISTSGFVGDILSFGCRSIPGIVGSATSKLGVVENVRESVGIASALLSVQKLLPLPF